MPTKEQRCHQIIDELFQIAQPGPVKNSLWLAYQTLQQEPKAKQRSSRGEEEQDQRIAKAREIIQLFRMRVGLSEKSNWGQLEIETFISFLSDFINSE